MNKVSTKPPILLALLLLLGTVAYAESQPWPLKRTIDLSSGFGDFRPNRFHAGVDLRTGGAVGAKVYSPVDGYIWRVKMSYRGYGKGLYIKGDDNHFYVLAHLDRFADRLNNRIRAEQFSRERYYLDISFPKDSIRVKQGELVAYSGKTGIGAPHLHFEKRTPDNVPIDPLTHGFELNDITPPSFERIGFHLLDDRSLFPGGTRKIFLPVREVSATEYVLDTVLYMNATFGVLAHCYDQMRPGGMRQAVKELTLMVDGKVVWESQFDSLPFEVGSVANIAYDPQQAANNEKRVRNLYNITTSDPFGVELMPKSGFVDVTAGMHRVALITTDAYENSAVLSFRFVSGPEELYTLDTCADGTCYFAPAEGAERLGFDSVWLERYDGKWQAVDDTGAEGMDNGWVRVRLSDSSRHDVYRLAFAHSSGARAHGRPFNGLVMRGAADPELSAMVTEGGLVVEVAWDSHLAHPTPVRLSHSVTPLISLTADQLDGSTEHYAYLSPESCFESIDYISSLTFDDKDEPRGIIRYPSIGVFGCEDREALWMDEVCTIEGGKSSFIRPTFLSIEAVIAPSSIDAPLASKRAYLISPEAFPLRQAIRVKIELEPALPTNPHTGLCWYDKKENEWVWIDNETENDDLAAGPSLGGGLFAAIIDTTKPTISGLNLKRGHKYWNSRLRVKFKLDDNLSGFEDDRSLDVRIDGNWLLPEFDIEDGDVVATMHDPLALGKHTLAINVKDRAGNEATKKVEFEVIRKSN